MKAAQLCFALLIACPCVISARKLVEEFGFHFFASTRPVAAKHTRLNQEKTKRSLWVLFLSSISVGVELSILFLESWATIPLAGDGTLYRQSFCTNRKAHQFTLLLFVLYFANLSHYVVDLVEFALAHFTRRRPATSDMMVFWVRFITICLMVSSFLLDYYRVGWHVLILMDPSDIPMEASKLIYFWHGKRQSLASSIGFCLFVALFAVLRLAIYPWIAWWLFFACKVEWIFVSNLTMLFILNAIWAGFIARAGLRIFGARQAAGTPSTASLSIN